MCVCECICAGRYSTGADRKFALLEDLFKKFPSMPVSVEIKENNRELIKKVNIEVNQCKKQTNQNLTIVPFSLLDFFFTFPENES